MVKPQGSLHKQAVLSPVGMELYLLQVVGRVDESVVVENMLGVREQQARDSLIQFIGIFKVTVILFFAETTYIYLYKVGFYYSKPYCIH